MLFPNKLVPPTEMEFPLIASYKMDGCRMLFNKGELQTRSGKPVVNIRIHEKYEWLKKLTKTLDIVLDGEFYCHGMPRNEITSYFMSQDKEIPEGLEFWCFDYLDDSYETTNFGTRHHKMMEFCDRHKIQYPQSFFVKDPEAADSIMSQALQDGYEGLILLSPGSMYKHGRITLPSGDGYKMKPYRTYDSKIIRVIQATEVDPEAEKKIDELGRSVTSKKKGDRVPVDKAASFVVLWNGKEVQPSLSMTDEEKKEVWENREDYIGRVVEWRGLANGMKDVPSHPTTVCMRPDKD